MKTDLAKNWMSTLIPNQESKDFKAPLYNAKSKTFWINELPTLSQVIDSKVLRSLIMYVSHHFLHSYSCLLSSFLSNN